MKKFKLLPLILILLLSVSLLPVSALALSEPSISASAAIVMDANSGDVYFEKNADASIQPASTTKLVTALLVAEAAERGEISLSDTVTADESCLANLDEDSSDCSPRLESGEIMTVEELLYCVMLASANEASSLLASYVSGSESAFVDAMNARVQELGCTGTHFANANGLEDSNHYSTARDFALIAQEAMRHSLVKDIAGTLHHTVPETNVAPARELTNTNSLLNPESEFYYDPAYGIKTGYYENAGYCLVSAAAQNDIDVICVVMGGQSMNDQFYDTLTLYRWLFENYEYRPILSSTDTVVTVPVRMGDEESVGARSEDTISAILPDDYDLGKIGYQYVLYHEATGEKLDAPVTVGQVLGEITVVEMDENGDILQTFGTSRLIASGTVEMSREEYLSSQLKDLFQEPVVRRIVTILIVLLAVYLLLVAFYIIQRVRHLQSVREAKRERAARMTETEARDLHIPEIKNEEPAIEYFGSPEPAPAETPAASREPEVEYQPEAPAPKKTAETPRPRRRMPKNELADDDYLDNFFNNRK
jgi:D-alanyl-D-alanine carboxypeptidase (penicillin-binding protein 5/6)